MRITISQKGLLLLAEIQNPNFSPVSNTQWYFWKWNCGTCPWEEECPVFWAPKIKAQHHHLRSSQAWLLIGQCIFVIFVWVRLLFLYFHDVNYSSGQRLWEGMLCSSPGPTTSVLCCSAVLWARASLCSPHCPRIQFIVQACLELTVVLLPQFPRITVLGFQVWATTLAQTSKSHLIIKSTSMFVSWVFKKLCPFNMFRERIVN